jgi:predicted amidohydrolase
MRIMLSALCCEKGALDANLAAHRAVLTEARDARCVLTVFPEMSLTGSVDPAGHPERRVELGDPAVLALAALTGELGVAAVFGIGERTNHDASYITQIFAEHGRLAGVQRKRRLGEDEVAYLTADEDTVFDLDGTRFAIAICAESEFDRPFEFARSSAAKLVCFCAAPGLYERRTTEDEWRAGWDWWLSAGLADAQRHARAHQLWIAIATQAGSTIDEDFPGLAALVDPRGEVVTRSDDWRSANLVVEVP